MDLPVLPVIKRESKRVKKSDLPTLPRIRSFRQLIQPKEEVQKESPLPPPPPKPKRTPASSASLSTQELAVPLKRIDKTRGKKLERTTINLKAVLENKICIRLKRCDGEIHKTTGENNNKTPSKNLSDTKAKQLTPTQFQLQNLKPEPPIMSIKTEKKCTSRLISACTQDLIVPLKRISKIRKIVNEDGKYITEKRRMVVLLRRIDENILFNITINNREALHKAKPKAIQDESHYPVVSEEQQQQKLLSLKREVLDKVINNHNLNQLTMDQKLMSHRHVEIVSTRKVPVSLASKINQMKQLQLQGKIHKRRRKRKAIYGGLQKRRESRYIPTGRGRGCPKK